jgi:hypothetical protein
LGIEKNGAVGMGGNRMKDGEGGLGFGHGKDQMPVHMSNGSHPTNWMHRMMPVTTRYIIRLLGYVSQGGDGPLMMSSPVRETYVHNSSTSY